MKRYFLFDPHLAGVERGEVFIFELLDERSNGDYFTGKVIKHFTNPEFKGSINFYFKPNCKEITDPVELVIYRLTG